MLIQKELKNFYYNKIKENHENKTTYFKFD